MTAEKAPFNSTAQPPTIAVALRYDEDGTAPIVVATGKGSLAERIIAAAEEAGVAIDENPLLASALENAPLDEPIPEELYQAVAEVISWVLHAREPHGAGGRSQAPNDRKAGGIRQ
ncbi:MAG: EscU/YscU/HrcU family type III secretion system export apparatus switch protein [Rhizobiales bacterium]|nr:EscU/YscU/HrcU family type III secretion system export apparatus switch protein [Hyphomicrobiales bacterium]MBO6699047.1 EscU/YscU/HrcU family type III secretion system export apparatus switch protein [Hyphomicrobiales bacterium]MBO6736585.1 EscU/YscU/HrcU family type III secretion system export apparatus switch protein [Hyphomicrobiales bacterium]MBO6912341.1 EscU/YscU/HrcU family type III secretion system export apparatus switch protein [Hyphomicrobiales bacterium]MBO6956296.1 EscU/YscU/Hr